MKTQTESRSIQFTVTGLDVVYARVSTDEQAGENKTSLDEQIEKSQDYLTRLGLTNFLVFREDYSGFEYDRPKLNEIRELIQQGKVRSFTFWRVDRISRKSGHLEQLREGYFIPFNVEIHSPFDLGKWMWTPSHIHMQNSLVNFAEYWGRILTQVMADGKIGLIKRGSVMTFGHSPFGYMEVKKKFEDGTEKRIFVIKEDEAEIIALIFELFVKQNMSLRQIAIKLNNDRVPTYTECRGGSTNLKKGIGIWQWSTVRQILANTAYDGIWTFGRTKNVKVLDQQTKRIRNKRVKNNEGLIQVPVERIIPHYLFVEAQAKLEHNKKQKVGNPAKYPYLLRKRMTCTCDYKMGSSQRDNGRYLYYACLCEVAGYSKKSCLPHYVNARLIDEKAWNWLYSILTNRELLKNKIDNYIAEKEKAIKPLKDRMTIIDRILTKAHKEHDVMVSSYFKLPELAQAKALSGMEELERRIKEDEQERSELQIQVEQLELNAMALKGWQEGYKEHGQEFADHIAHIQTVDEQEWWYQAWLENNGRQHIGIDYRKLADLSKNDEPLTFEEKRKYIEQFDVQGKLIKEDGKLFLHLTCILEEEILMELCNCLSATIQNQQKLKLVFSDKFFLLDLSSLPQFNQVEATA